MATKLKPKPSNIEIISITYDTQKQAIVGIGKNGNLYFYEKGEWYKY